MFAQFLDHVGTIIQINVALQIKFAARGMFLQKYFIFNVITLISYLLIVFTPHKGKYVCGGRSEFF